MIIAIDGPAGSGKSTAAKIIAQRLNYRYIDTGAMYRTVALSAQRRKADLHDLNAVAEVAEKLDIQLIPNSGGQQVLLDGEDVTQLLYNETVGAGAAIVAAQPRVREILIAKQRELGKDGRVVMDGRDIGTVVFPQAEFKFFMEANPEERGRRRYLEIKEKNPSTNLEEIIDQVKKRDYEDRNREISPLVMAEDGRLLDTTDFNPEEVVEHILKIIREK